MTSSLTKVENTESSKIEAPIMEQQKKIEALNERTLGHKYRSAKSIKLVEKADPKKIQNVLDTEDVKPETKKALSKYMKKRVGTSNRFAITYNFSAGWDDGRRFAEGLIGLQSIPGPIRRYISGEFYRDIDVHNCMPTILLHLLTQLNIGCPGLESYVADRAGTLEQIGMDKDTFLHALNYNKLADSSAPLLCQIHGTIFNVLVPALQCDEKWKPLWKKCKNRPYNAQGSFVSRVVQRIEDGVLCEMVGWFEKHLAAPEVLIFDGCLIPRAVVVHDEALRSCEGHILETCGLSLILAEKSMEEDPRPYEQDPFAEIKLFDDELLNSKALAALKSPCDADIGSFAAMLWKDTYQYDKTQDEWWYFENHCWHTDKGHHFQFRLHEELRKTFDDVEMTSERALSNREEFRYVLGSNSKCKNITMVAALHFACKDFKRFSLNLNKNLYLLCFQNGVYDFGTHTFREGWPQDFITIQMEYAWIPYEPASKESTRISTALAQILPQDEKRAYVMRALSSTLTAEHSEKLHLLHGEGGNGKSLLTKLTEESLGGRATAWSTSILTQQFDCCAPNPELADGEDKVFINVQEGKKGGALNMQTVKVITGGDSCRARRLYKNGGKFVIVAQIWLSLNTLPLVEDLDHGTWRRLRVILFESTFVEPGMPTDPSKHIYAADPTFKKDIPSLLPAYMALLIDYYKQYQTQGNAVPRLITEATEKFRKSQNIYQAFFDDCCEPSDKKAKAMEVWRACQTWAKRENYQVQRSDLKQFLIKAGFVYAESIKFGPTSVTSGYKGMVLKAE